MSVLPTEGIPRQNIFGLIFFSPPLPPRWLLLRSPMLVDPHFSQQHAGLQQSSSFSLLLQCATWTWKILIKHLWTSFKLIFLTCHRTTSSRTRRRHFLWSGNFLPRKFRWERSPWSRSTCDWIRGLVWLGSVDTAMTPQTSSPCRLWTT